MRARRVLTPARGDGGGRRGARRRDRCHRAATTRGHRGRRPRRRRGAAARPRRHPRARQRARPHRVGGLRDRHPGRRGRRRHHHPRHAAQQHPADRARSRRCRSSGSPRDGRCHVDVGFWGGAIPGNLDDLRGLHDEGVFGFKCFLAPSGVDEFPPLPGRPSSTRYLAELAGFGGMMIVHAEDGDALERAPDAQRAGVRRTSSPPGRAASRTSPSRSSSRPPGTPGPPCTCCTCPARTRCRCCARLGATGSPSPSRRARTTSSSRRRRSPTGATQFKCCPPIREADNREDLWAALGPRRHRLRRLRPLALRRPS